MLLKFAGECWPEHDVGSAGTGRYRRQWVWEVARPIKVVPREPSPLLGRGIFVFQSYFGDGDVDGKRTLAGGNAAPY